MSLKEEFQCSKLGLNCAKLSDFYKPAWSCMHQVVLLVIRGIFIVYMTVMMFLSIEQADTSSEERHDGWSPYWLIYFTSWNYLFGLLYFIMAFIISLKFLCNRSDNESDNMEMGGANYGSVNVENGDQQTKLPVYIKIFWVVYTQALSVATVVVLSYWFIIFDGELKADFSRFSLSIDMVLTSYWLLSISSWTEYHSSFSISYTLQSSCSSTWSSIWSTQYPLTMRCIKMPTGTPTLVKLPLFSLG